ncbi:MAG: DUF2188 domain-containing protein [Candidatus Moranbacteria bacterium]|nr:DUF2188 domain-containing protein [Candidatus Moranbacteria bacterium]
MVKNLHVVKNGNSWAVKREGNPSPVSRHRTQSNAIDRATSLARSERSEMLVHGRNGQIRERNSFGGDPYPPRG